MRGLSREHSNSRSGFFRQSSWVAFNAVAILGLAACGGGGGGGSDPPSDPVTDPPPTNAAPAVTAGADQTIQLPTDSVQLQGSADDDDLPANSTLTYAWTSSPEGVTFADAAAASTTATFPAEGTYTLTLTASDGALSGTDALTVTVEAASGPVNAAPTVSAGADQTITLSSSAALQGSATDDGLPSTTLTYEWSVAGGAAGVTFADAAVASTTATFDAAGAYELVLSVSDGELTGTDSLIVNVNADVFPAADTTEDDPDHGWARVAPADVGMDAALLAQAQAVAEAAGGAGMIVRGGRLVHSWGDIDEREDHPSQSATKSIGGMALGFAIDDGLLALSDLASTHLPTVGVDPRVPPLVNNDPAQLAQITILQLATHTAGFEKPGGYGALLFAPGTTWSYSDGGLNWLADTLTTVFAQDLNDVLTARVWTHLGVDTDDVRWRLSSLRPEPRPNGIVHRELASGIRINANAMARVGLLFLREGMWSDVRILSEEFVTTVQTPPPENATLTNADPIDFPGATTNYGVLWWTNAEGLLPNVPQDAYWAWGQGESLIVVIPSLDLVISRIGPFDFNDTDRFFGSGKWNADYAILAPFLDPIAQSVTP